MRSRNKKKIRKKQTRTEKIITFFKWGSLLLLFVLIICVLYLGYEFMIDIFRVRDIQVMGNYRLDSKEIIKESRIKTGNSLMRLDLNEIRERLRKNNWIREVRLKKRFPDSVIIKIRESRPEALLSAGRDYFLIDDRGKILEKIDGDTIPFLPVINGISHRDHKTLKEAIMLVRAINEVGVFSDKDLIQIGLDSYGLKMNVDGELIKVGFGNYTEKLDRWRMLEPELKKKGLKIEYVDLRYRDSVIVKPYRPKENGRKS